ncbi:MAG: response regulator transcription factor [Chloroflexi bacterium]|nr:response regulator transcription factor [Chloroflexota bacterium]
MTTRVIVADGEPLFRGGLAQLLATQPDMRVVGEAGDTREAIEQTWREQPDVVLLALDLPPAGGQEAARRIRSVGTGVKVIMLVPPHGDEEHPGLDDGVHSVLQASARASQIFDRIRAVKDAGASREAAPAAAPEADELDGVEAPERLTAREQEVMALIARAWTNRQIEESLGIQKSTVKRHVRHILRKLHARNRVQAAVLAYRATHLPQGGATG